jgi:O-antigen ligase
MATMRTSPVIGYGFGKPMQTPYPLADISGSYIFWNIMPHNSILWVWMRLGTVGYLLLWFMIGTAIVQAARLALQIKDSYLKGLAVWIMLLVMQQVVFGYLDLQWTNYRNLITLGILFALPSRLAAFASATDRVDVAAGSPAVPSRRRPRKPYIPHTLSVIDGRLR